MHTVSHGRVVAIPRTHRQAPTSARGVALQRWHGAMTVRRIVDTMQDHPRFPCIQGGAQ